MRIGFSLGSNSGDRFAQMCEARDRISTALDASAIQSSPLYETSPVGVREEYRHLNFLNAVVSVETSRSARDWLAACRAVEDSMGRIRVGDRYAPRTIDVDILFAGVECIDSADLTVPHPRWMKRRFVVQPLADIHPDLVLPCMETSVADYLDRMDDPSDVWLYERPWSMI
jgi:2-amino-4-hydroxy-6-hydroxymethyldihydropteridine diphosphokinase